MHSNLIERSWADLDQAASAIDTVRHLTGAAEPQWCGIVDLGPAGTYTLEPGWRHDVYVLRGDAKVGDQKLDAGDFLIQCGAAVVHPGRAGARLLLYREASTSRCEPVRRSAAAREWRAGRYPHMDVVLLSNSAHRVSLVKWAPGARTGEHTHSNGEEIFVLSGELSNGEARYPAGTWLRLHPGARHEPFAEVPAVILLRNGHLRAAAE
jgi:quercetin dioxygenase-like cupin family protein